MSGVVTLPIVVLCAAILVVLVIRAAIVIRNDTGRLRGSPPGKGDHVINAEYSSGLGGQPGQFTVPKDPDEYARRFVPRRSR